jgi:hypothetical protein
MERRQVAEPVQSALTAGVVRYLEELGEDGRSSA